MQLIPVLDKFGNSVLIPNEIIDILIEIHKSRQYDPKNQYFVKPFEYTFTLKNNESVSGYVKDSDCDYGYIVGFDEAILLEFTVVKREGESYLKTIDIANIKELG